jgi:DNA-binding MarR family transcriptional regulator
MMFREKVGSDPFMNGSSFSINRDVIKGRRFNLDRFWGRLHDVGARLAGQPRVVTNRRSRKRAVGDDTAACLDSIRRIVQALRRSAGQTQARTGLSSAQLFVLASLAESPSSSLTDLGRRTFTDRTSVAGVVEKLVRRRLVRRSRAVGDRRSAALWITPDGRARVKRAPTAAGAHLRDAIEGLRPGKRRQLATALADLVDAMGLSAAPAPMLFSVNGRSPRSRG